MNSRLAFLETVALSAVTALFLGSSKSYSDDKRVDSAPEIVVPGGNRVGGEAAGIEKDGAVRKTSRRVTPVPTIQHDASALRARGQLDHPGDGKFGLDEGSPVDDRVRRARD